MFSFRLIHRSCCGLWVVMAWWALGMPTAFGDELCTQETRLQVRLLQRAETYLNSIDGAASLRFVPYTTVVRGLLHAGFSPDHPFLRSKIDILLRITPRDQFEAMRQREIALLRSSDRPTTFALSRRDVSTVRAFIVSDDYNENYRRFGVVRLPRGSAPDGPCQPSAPEHETGHFLVAAPGSSSSCRLSEVAGISESSLDSGVSSNACRFVEIDRQPSFVLIAQTIRLRI